MENIGNQERKWRKPMKNKKGRKPKKKEKPIKTQKRKKNNTIKIMERK